jgi:hypothetical protein
VKAPQKILEAQLEAAYLAVEKLGSDRDRLKSNFADSEANLEDLKKQLSFVQQAHLETLQVLDKTHKATMEELSGALKVEHDRDVEALKVDYEREVEAFSAAYEAVTEALSNTYLELKSERAVLERVYASTSWRATGFLRTGVENIRKLKKFCVRILKLIARGIYRAIRNVLVGLLDAYTRAAKWRRMNFGAPRSLWGVTPILTLPLLVRCDRMLGFRSQSMVFTTYHITRNFDVNLEKLVNYVYSKHPSWSSHIHRLVLRLSLTRYDVYNYYCDRSILLPTRRMEVNEFEMQKIRKFDHALYTYTYGADIRTRQTTLELGKYNFCYDCPAPMKFCQCDEAAGRANVERIGQYANAMVALGDMVEYVPGCRNFYYWPLDMERVKYTGCDWDGRRTLRIAHAPNHSHFKGTQYLERAVEQLRAEGRDIEILRVSGVPNEEVLKLFASCDMMADQFIGGAPGYAAFEAMAIGKPVLCYLRNQSMVTDPDHCPIFNTWPDTIYDTLKACLDGEFDLAALGERGRNYVETYCSLDAVALNLGQMYLETAGFPPRINKRIKKRMNVLRSRLPQAMPGIPPVAWRTLDAIEQSDVREIMARQAE